MIFRIGLRWTIAVGLCLVLTGSFFEYKRRGGLYWYDVQQDYRYSFPSGTARRVQIQIIPEGFSVPRIGEAWDTAVLPIDVGASLAGHWFEPAIELQSGDARSIQYFERGAEGRRFILLKPDLLKSGRPVSMSGKHMTWTQQGREVLLFSNPGATRGRTLVIAPHPDDAEIAAFGFYSRHDSYVATVTAGDSVDDLYLHLESDSAGRRLLRGRARVWDSLVVPTWGGVPPERIVNLGYWNDSLAQLFARRTSQEEASAALDKDPNVYRSGAVQELLGGRSAHATWHSLVEDLRVLLRTIRPAVIVAPHPLLDAAPDHQLTSIALLEAMENGSADDGLLLLYTNHHVLAEYYPFGPANTEMTLPPWFDAAAEFGGVFSYALGPIDRQRKLFALESMHDLRAAPRAVTAEDPAGRFLQMASNALREIRRNPLGTYSYYRRAVRTNELFFVYRFSDRIHISIPELQEFSYQ